ncbi:MAG: signal transduction histidine kinase/DNA-binding response OmpR family regulator [Saprospiraceae bacterium]|jgi:signal transduction histidine kinase/DNA-binding response OmpR family regulator/ligand-binding sensor domain-containing protein
MFISKHILLLGLVTLCSSFSHGQNQTNFNHISPVLNNNVISITQTEQDALGYMWMLFGNGVLKYDGYDYKLIKNKTLFSKWQSTDKIKNIISDEEKNIWLITEAGLVSKYNSHRGNYEDLTLLIAEPIQKIRAKEGGVWLLTKSNILYSYIDSKINKIASIFNNKTLEENVIGMDLTNPNEVFLSTDAGRLYHYEIISKELNELIGPFTGFPGNLILTSDKNNKLWIGTETFGFFIYDAIKKEFIQDSFFTNEKFKVDKELFLTVFLDSNGFIWGGTDGGGLYKIDSNNGEIDLFTKHDSNESSLRSNTILNISEDNHKNIWISTNYGKLNILPFKNNNIGYHEGSSNNTPQRVLSIFKSSKGILWLGTDGSGLTKVSNNSKNAVISESQYFSNTDSNNRYYVQSIIEDSNANMWFGTYKNGLFFHDTKKNIYNKITIANSKNQAGTDVRTIFKDNKNRIWVGSNTSINVYNSELKLLAVFDNISHDLEGSILQSVIEDKDGVIWLGTDYSLFRLEENLINLQNSSFSEQSSDGDDNIKIKGVRHLALDKSNNLLLISNEGKLLQFDTKSQTFSTFDHVESIKDVNLATVFVDDDNLWLSSNNGIICLNIKNNITKAYYKTDGLQDNMFLSRSAYKDSQGILYFGGIKGINYFNPRNLNENKSHANLYINEVEILNQPIDSLIPISDSSGINNLESLDLKNSQSSFSFRFSAIDDILNPKYYYAYRLKGFDKGWITNHAERLATYTNIPAGDYTFEVKASTKSNSWDISTKQINVSIEEPYWNKPIAYILYLGILLSISYAIRRWYLLKKKLILEEVSHKKENELHELKMNFFAKMSHEIQTPITLILGPIDNMMSMSEKNGNLLLKQRLTIISNNAKRLSKIARELTLVRNKELGTLQLLVTRNNLWSNIEEISLSFKELARNKQIDFVINCPKSLFDTWYDKEKIEHIIYNLLSNAFKFTPKEGYIQLNVVPTNSKKLIKISITDTGSGIRKDELNAIFELFYQSNIGKKNKGSGIGLALTKELIDLHKGKIEVESAPNEGTTFTVSIPITEDAYTESERITTNGGETTNTNTNTNTLNNNNNSINQEESSVNKKTILIVEDNYDLQSFLKELLILQYNVILAENGEEGYYYAKSNLPDLILSDIIMPKLDGIEMCKKLQNDSLTKHIPVVLLTANNSTNSKISGLKSGAIEYISKPFNTNELLLKVKNIISSKEHIISKYRKESINRPEVLIDKSQDEIFLESLVSIVNLRLDDANFKLEELATSLNMSYSRLYRKCQSLTGNSLVDFVRLLRLKKGAILLTKYGYNISESAFKTGFNDPKYFSKCFKKHFKITPGNFKKEAQKTDVSSYLKKYSIDDLDH